MRSDCPLIASCQHHVDLRMRPACTQFICGFVPGGGRNEPVVSRLVCRRAPNHSVRDCSVQSRWHLIIAGSVYRVVVAGNTASASAPSSVQNRRRHVPGSCSGFVHPLQLPVAWSVLAGPAQFSRALPGRLAIPVYPGWHWQPAAGTSRTWRS